MWKTPRTLLVAGTALVAGLAVGAAIVPAVAAQDPVLTPEQQATLRQQVDAYKACLQEQGVTLPEKPADGSRPELTDEERAALRAALRAAHEACASVRPSRPELSEEQRATLRTQVEQHRECLRGQLRASGVTLPEKPERPADGSRPPRPQLTDEQRAAIEAARAACEDLRPNLGVEGLGPFGGRGPGRGFGGPGGPGAAPGSTTAI